MPNPLPSTARDDRAQRPTPHAGTHSGSGTDPIEGVYHTGSFATVTQDTSITTPVTINALRGQITTVSQTLAAGSGAIFTVNNNRVQAGDVVVVHLGSTSSAGGPWLVFVSAVANGSFNIAVRNDHNSDAGNNTLTINFAVLTTRLV